MNKPETIDAYIADFPEEVQRILQEMRTIIKTAAPETFETISYGIPTFKNKGNVVHFGGFKNHTGFYPGAGAIKDFADELSLYAGAKGSVQFAYDQPLPEALITKIVKYRVQQDLEKAATRGKKK
jgi:uncharacterized protein YdhG (YjbR/CyaY superfamily)